MTKTKHKTQNTKAKQENSNKTQQKTNQPAQTRSNTLINVIKEPKQTQKDCTIRLDNYETQDVNYIHQIIKTHKTKCEYFEDITKTYRLYYFENSTDSKTFLTNVERPKLSNTSLLQTTNVPLYADSDTSLQDTFHSDIDEDSATEGAFSSESEEGEIKEDSHNTRTTPTNSNTHTATNTQRTQNNTVNTYGYPHQNIVKIFHHVNKGGNPFFLKNLCTTHKVPLPFTHYYGAKTNISTYIFDSKQMPINSCKP